MRDIPAALAARLTGATTLCHAWKLIRRDGLVLGFADHDRDLAVDGTTFVARSGLEAADATAELGFAVGSGEVSGALVSAAITDSDIAAGRYDDATVETWLVDWAAPDARLLLDIASIGEIRRGDGAFVAELRGIMHRLDETRGRVYRATCSADLGDQRCGIDLSDPAFRAEGAVLDTDGASLVTTDALAGFAEGWFTRGRLTWTSGANGGIAVEVRVHRRAAGGDALALWRRMSAPIAPGDGFALTAGCDKAFATCRTTFANTLNFRGFPHMPGNDFVVRQAAGGTSVLDGGSLFR